MSGDYWLNRIGTAAAVTTPSGSIPQYGLAADVGTAPWPDAQSFNAWAVDEARRGKKQEIAALEKAREEADQGWFQSFLSGAVSTVTEGVGFVARGPFQDLDEDTAKQNREMGGKVFETAANVPVVKQALEGIDTGFQILSTPLVLDRNVGLAKDMSLWFDKSSWAAAWREADDRTIGEALLDDVLVATQGTKKQDLDRMRRTNSLYGMTSFAADLALGFKLDPTVIAAKGAGEALAIGKGAMPRGQSSKAAFDAAKARVTSGERYRGLNPAGHYGSVRGRLINSRFDALREDARTMSLSEFTNKPMFYRNVVNGPQAALAFKIAAQDDHLWDLTRRAVMGDPKAFREINELKVSVPDELKRFTEADTATFIDAIEATKTKMTTLQSEVEDLEKAVAKREEAGRPQKDLSQRRVDLAVKYRGADGARKIRGGANPGFYEYHTWELKRDLEGKVADITAADEALARYDDYGTWLEKIKDEGVWSSISQVDRGGVKGLNELPKPRQRTYQKSIYGKVHQVREIARSTWLQTANPIDLHRVESGTLSIRRQFEQFGALFGYSNAEAFDDILNRFIRAKDPLERFKIAQEVEDVHLIGALSQKHGLAPETIDAFLRQTRIRKNEMAEALLSGNGAVYSTVPNPLAAEGAKLIKLKDGMAEIEVMENGKRVTYRVPEESLQPQTLPVDVTQTPNYYTPMDTRQVHLAIKRNRELFELLDSDFRNKMRGAGGKTMETVDAFGTAWNSIWKPMQLFRLAWPQRVLMDENFRAMAALGMSEWSRNFGKAFLFASMNAINPTLHGIGPFLERRRMKIGPGPLADEVTGRTYDVATHEEILGDAPAVPASLAPTPDGARMGFMAEFMNDAARARTIRTQARALMRNPNPHRSLPEGARPPANWLDINDVLDGPQGSSQFTRALSDQRRAEQSAKLRSSMGGEEDFTPEDIIYARLAQDELTDQEVVDMLAGNPVQSDAARIEEFIGLPKATQRAVWEGSSDDFVLERYREFAPDTDGNLSRLGDDAGRLRYALKTKIAEGKKRFDAEVQHRKSAKGSGPLFSDVFIDIESPMARLDMMAARELGAKYVPVDASLENFTTSAIKRAVARWRLDIGGDMPLMRNILRHHEWNLQNASKGPQVTLFDPVSNKVTRQGYAVRVATADIPLSNRIRGALTGEQLEVIENLVGSNADLLGAKGYRLMLENNQLSVVRYFRTDQRDTAIEFARHTNADSFYRLGGLPSRTKSGKQGDKTGPGYEVYMRDWNDQSPIVEELQRRFVQEDPKEFIAGKAPIQGKPGVYHGSTRELPEDMLPREEAPLDHGNLVGQGFYTTISRQVAESYGGNLYTIRGSKTGKTYKVFDVEQLLRDDVREDFKRFMDEYYEERRAGDPESVYDEDLAYAMDEVDHANTYLDLFHSLESWYVGVRGTKQPQQLLTDFLEDRFDAGALTHTGGRLIGGFGEHQVFVWLHPEDLMVRPAYDKTGKFHLLEDWFTNPESMERTFNKVPESRIVRSGKRDKRFGELEQVHRKRMERERSIQRRRMDDPNAPMIWDDPTYNALLGREQKIMSELGVEYTHNVTGRARYAGVTPDEGNWWTQVDPDRIPRQRRHAAQGVRAAGDLRRAEKSEMDSVADAFGDLDFKMADSVHERFVRRLLKKKEFGKGHSKWKTADGKYVVAQNVFEGEGEAYVPLMSAAPTYARLTDTYKRTLSKYRGKAVGYKRIQPPDVSPETLRTASGKQAALEYYVGWADLLNDQIRNSPIWYRMLEGQTDDEILSFLTKTDEGARIRRQLPHKGRDPERWIEEHRQALDFYLPDENMRALLRDQRIKASDLRHVNPRDLPEIYGPDLEMIGGEKGWGREIASLSEKIYHALGTVPTDTLSRQPFAKAMYDLKMRNLIRTTKSEWLTPELMKDYEKLSREFAIRQLRKTLFDLTDEMNMTQALRFIAPFWGAQLEAMTKWARIAIERPETVARFYVGINQVYDQLQVIDEDGRPVDDAKGLLDYDSNHRVILQIPENLKKLPFFDKALNNFGRVGVAFGSANTALQGDNFFAPSLGPLVTVPADELVNAMWDDHGASFDDNFFYRWLFPVGRPSEGFAGKLEQVFPGWGRRMLAIQEGQDSRMWANTWFTVYREMALDNKTRGLPPPTPEEVEKATKWHFALRVVASFAAPAAMEFRPQNQFYLDQYHEMQRRYGPGQAFEKFVEKYGADAAKYAASSSTGLVPPTGKGMEEWKQTKDLLQKISDSGHPELANSIFSPDAWADDFSSDSYREQFEIGVGPGSNKRLREPQDPQERIRKSDVRIGWLQYRQFMAGINADLYNRGLTSLEQHGAEDLKQLKRDWVARKQEELPAWSDDYHTYSDTVYRQVDLLRQVAKDRRFDSRPDIQGLRQYLMLRDAAAQSLDQWGAQGGSRSLQAEENTELRNWFYSQVGELIQANPAFGEFYTRFLDSDRLERGSGP